MRQTTVVGCLFLAAGAMVAQPYHVNPGGANITDSNNVVWAADTPSGVNVSGGSGASGSYVVHNLQDSYQAPVYNSARQGNFTYTFAVSQPGAYSVTFKFDDFQDPWAGQRVFNVKDQDNNYVLQNFDIAAVSGGRYYAYDRTVTVNACGSSLSLSFTSVQGDPAQVNGIAVVYQGAGNCVQKVPITGEGRWTYGGYYILNQDLTFTTRQYQHIILDTSNPNEDHGTVPYLTLDCQGHTITTTATQQGDHMVTMWGKTPTIVNCHFVNTASAVNLGAVIDNVIGTPLVFSGNSFEKCSAQMAGGQGMATVTNNTGHNAAMILNQFNGGSSRFIVQNNIFTGDSGIGSAINLEHSSHGDMTLNSVINDTTPIADSTYQLVEVHDATFTHNTGIGSLSAWCLEFSDVNDHVTVDSNTFGKCWTAAIGGWGAIGAGYTFGLTDSRISNNTVTGTAGGSIFLIAEMSGYYGRNYQVANNLIYGNTCPLCASNLWQVWLPNSNATVHDNTLFDNQMGGVLLSANVTPAGFKLVGGNSCTNTSSSQVPLPCGLGVTQEPLDSLTVTQGSASFVRFYATVGAGPAYAYAPVSIVSVTRSGTLPPGMTADRTWCPANALCPSTLGFGTNPGLTLYGTPTTPGNYSFSITVLDSLNNQVTVPFTVVINAAPNPCETAGSNQFSACYWNGTTWGDSANKAASGNEVYPVAYSWGSTPAQCPAGVTNCPNGFSGWWYGTFNFTNTYPTFTATVGGGSVMVEIDGTQVYAKQYDGSAHTYQFTQYVGAGNHTVKFKFTNAPSGWNGMAAAGLTWQ